MIIPNLDRWITGNYGEDAFKEEKPVTYCTDCGRPLYAGDTAYRFVTDLICEECIAKAREEVREND